MSRRRSVLVALGLGALALPLGTLAQPPGKVWRVGFLAHRRVNFVDSDYQYGPFRQGMRELGYVEGKNLAIEWRSAEGSSERLPALAAELVKLNVDVIVAGGTPATRAVQLATKNATPLIPIVMSGVADPVGSGFIDNLARPGGNITGVTNINVELGPKQVETLLAMLPKVERVAVLINPTNVSHAAYLRGCQEAGHKLGISAVVPANASTPQEIETAFSMMVREKVEALIVARDGFLNQQVRQVSALAARQRLPTIGGLREYADAGGLISYGPSIADQFRWAAAYVDKILKGAKPGDLPVERPRRFELFISQKAARALGLAIPQSLLMSADKVIE
ncbi:MAG: ABC transporter substrate-binding protein [Betaproteobacteria bacterium]|nr:MAG: ABC transporter substrate-binding protein [Betaproteobacteria bacterium]